MADTQAKSLVLAPGGNVAVGMDTVAGFQALMNQAQLLANSTIIPETFQQKPENCLIACNMANRMHADALAVMQNMYIVYGNPSFSAKFLIGCFNTCGRYTSIKYQFFGTKGKDDWGCRAYCTEIATGEKIVGIDVDIDMAKKEGWYTKKESKWQTIPQIMLQYRAATFLIRTTAPELSLGLTREELEDIDMQPANDGTYVAQDSFEAAAAKVDQEIAAAPVQHVTVPAQQAKMEAPKEAYMQPAAAAKSNTPSFAL